MLDFGFYNIDCMEGMKEFSNNYFDLAIVDPPYGLGYDTAAKQMGGKQWANNAAAKKVYHGTGWDIRPSEQYFNELFRVSKNQIIWGGNYFTDFLPPSKCFICWDKRINEQMRNDFADAEYAWVSESLGVARMFRYLWNGILQENMRDKEERIHPTQKPVALYKWILQHYTKAEDLILDTHVGSASSLIACEDMGRKYVGFEIDKTYYDMARERMADYSAQLQFKL